MGPANQSRLGARTLESLLVIAALLLCGVRTLAQEGSSNKPAAPQRGATINSAMLASKTYSEMLTQYRLKQKDIEMRVAFPHTTTGAALARVATLVPYGLRRDNVSEVREMAQDLALLRASPDPALADLESGFRTLPEKYWAERQFLIQIGGRLAAPRAEVVNFLKAEMSRPVKISADHPSDLAYLSPVVAADMLVIVVSDPAQRDAAFRQAVKVQPDRDVSRLILSRYEVVDAERARNLATQLDLLKK